MTLREALVAATDSAGRIHSTRALAVAIEEADARHALACAWGLEAWEAAREATADAEAMAAPCAECEDLRGERDEARDVVNRCADALRRRVPEMASRGGPCLPGEVDHALSSAVHFRDEARRERDEAIVSVKAEAERIVARREAIDGILYGTRSQLCEVLGIDRGMSGAAIVAAVCAALRERDESRESLRLSVAAWDAAGMQGRDAASVIAEAEERGARWAIASWYRRPFGIFHADHDAFRREEAARICREARERGEHG